MTALDLSGTELFASGRHSAVRGRWTLAAGGTVEIRPRAARKLLPRRAPVQTRSLVSGALVVRDPVHLTVGEIAVAADKTRTVRITLADVTALGNRRYAVDVIVSDLGENAGPDELATLEGFADEDRDGTIRAVLSGPAPTGLGGPSSRIRLSATFAR
ncbi:MAG: hypothetical protein ACRDVE_08200 [Actinocrinis sp.]